MLTKKILTIVGTIIALILLICLLVIWQWFSFLHEPLVSKEKSPINFTLLKGSSVTFLAHNLNNAGILKYPRFFILLAKQKHVTSKLIAGEYQITPGLTAEQLLIKMVKGEVILHTFTIVEGWTFKKMLAELDSNPYLVHTLINLNNDSIMKILGSEGQNPEGRFAPATYYFSGTTPDILILKKSYDLMQQKLEKAWQNRSSDTKYNCPYKALIVASIIEKETALESERPKIAGVIFRRLELNMPLQMDPTVIYGLGDDLNGKLTMQNLRDASSYNTYTHRDLPPTPIAFPSDSSLNAALHPEMGTALYYVAKGDGSHVFSNTLAEHNQAVEKYILKR